MSMTLEDHSEKETTRRNWLLSAPALVILIIAAAGPLLIMLVYSFLSPGDYGNVIWKFSTKGWVQILVERDIFDDTLSFADAHLSVDGK